MLKRGWMRFVTWLGRAQTALLLSLVYLLGIGPLWLFVCLIGRRDLLATRGKPSASFALPKPTIPTDRERCERQF
jgi:hypothetical protein